MKNYRNQSETAKAEYIEKRENLKALSRTVKANLAAFDAETVNDAIINVYAEKEGLNASDFKTFWGWKEDGMRVKKGEKGFAIWAKPKNLTDKTIPPPTNGDPADTYRFFGLAYMFNKNQVEPIPNETNEPLVIYKQKLSLKRYSTQFEDFPPIQNSQNANTLASMFWDKDEIGYRESIYCAYFNQQNLPIAWAEISKGAISSCLCDSRIILSHAFMSGATALMMFHNHPSFNNKPSQSDIDLTNKVKQACKTVDINFLDHIIVTPEFKVYYSFADNDLIAA